MIQKKLNYFYPSYIYITYIMSRSYQQQIRKYALKNKENKCPITGINISSSLDAAHIKPDANCIDDEKKDNNNILLLSKNLHPLFDKHRFTINPITHTIEVCKYYIDFEEMKEIDFLKQYDGMKVNCNSDMNKYLEYRYLQFITKSNELKIKCSQLLSDNILYVLSPQSFLTIQTLKLLKKTALKELCVLNNIETSTSWSRTKYQEILSKRNISIKKENVTKIITINDLSKLKINGLSYLCKINNLSMRNKPLRIDYINVLSRFIR